MFSIFASIKCLHLLLCCFLGPCFFLFLPHSAFKDAAVSCVLLETCVLPCSFEPGPDPVIHWTKEPHGQTPVHIYFKGQNSSAEQFYIPHPNFTGRASLFV
ncbi:hypothetical protein NL108_018368 [Boleophthalmus pectinirostris]|nr:hypothetical protein NL108_018368 [Boleophthalmus pectinirostris]